MGCNLRGFRLHGFAVRHAAVLGRRVVGDCALYWCSGGHGAGGAGGIFPMGLGFGVHVVDGCVSDHSGIGWQYLGAAVVFRGSGFTPDCHHRGGIGVWRAVGILGHILCHPAGNRSAVDSEGVATTGGAGYGGSDGGVGNRCLFPLRSIPASFAPTINIPLPELENATNSAANEVFLELMLAILATVENRKKLDFAHVVLSFSKDSATEL